MKSNPSSSWSIVCALYLVVSYASESNAQEGHAVKLQRNGLIQILVDPGEQNQAVTYYRTIVSPATGLPLVDGNGVPQNSLDDILVFAGYRGAGGNGITADRLERFESADLMDVARLKAAVTADGGNAADVPDFAAGDVLATRWFAPKITDATLQDEYQQFGWRKLVRLRPLPGDATTRHIKSIHLLFNVFATRQQILANPPVSPFANRSANNQVILVRDKQTTPADEFAANPVFWLVFASVPDKNGILGFALNASFDYRHPTAAPPNSQYFVPRACAQCHGGVESAGKLNFLDTDHWLDRIASDDDFPVIAQTAHGVVFDGGKDPLTPQFAQAFSVIRSLNAEIQSQNEDLDAVGATFQVRSVRNWNAIHAANDQHVGILDDRDRDGFLDRSITGDSFVPNPLDRWRKNDRIDEALVPLLNRYCYRCHSSLAYSIYDRSAVVFRSRPNGNLPGGLQTYITAPDPFVPFMPQDRVLKAADRNRIVDLVNRLPELESIVFRSPKTAPSVTIEITGTGSGAKYIEVGQSQQLPVNVLVDQTVRWTNRSNVGHTATSDRIVGGQRLFDTGSIPVNNSADAVFDRALFQRAGGQPGGSVSIKYFCVPHPGMRSEVILTDAPPNETPVETPTEKH